MDGYDSTPSDRYGPRTSNYEFSYAVATAIISEEHYDRVPASRGDLGKEVTTIKVKPSFENLLAIKPLSAADTEGLKIPTGTERYREPMSYQEYQTQDRNPMIPSNAKEYMDSIRKNWSTAMDHPIVTKSGQTDRKIGILTVQSVTYVTNPHPPTGGGNGANGGSGQGGNGGSGRKRVLEERELEERTFFCGLKRDLEGRTFWWCPPQQPPHSNPSSSKPPPSHPPSGGGGNGGNGGSGHEGNGGSGTGGKGGGSHSDVTKMGLGIR
ncbi:hypothetical protein HJFPF1_05217 [Paramyrothecium foliicola]|nr:hypothetical protein HJFPF1_05217 [Paramyrothecium foliicola]